MFLFNTFVLQSVMYSIISGFSLYVGFFNSSSFFYCTVCMVVLCSFAKTSLRRFISLSSVTSHLVCCSPQHFPSLSFISLFPFSLLLTHLLIFSLPLPIMTSSCFTMMQDPGWGGSFPVMWAGIKQTQRKKPIPRRRGRDREGGRSVCVEDEVREGLRRFWRLGNDFSQKPSEFFP